MGKEQRAVCSGGLVIVVEAAAWLEFGLSPRSVVVGGRLVGYDRYHTEVPGGQCLLASGIGYP